MYNTVKRRLLLSTALSIFLGVSSLQASVPYEGSPETDQIAKPHALVSDKDIMAFR